MWGQPRTGPLMTYTKRSSFMTKDHVRQHVPLMLLLCFWGPWSAFEPPMLQRCHWSSGIIGSNLIKMTTISILDTIQFCWNSDNANADFCVQRQMCYPWERSCASVKTKKSDPLMASNIPPKCCQSHQITRRENLSFPSKQHGKPITWIELHLR